MPPVDKLPVPRRKKTSSLGRTVEARSSLLGHQALGLGVELDPGEDLFVANAAARIGVDDAHELRNRVHAVAHDVSGDTFGHGDELAANDQHAVIEAR